MPRVFANIFFLSFLIPGCTFIEQGSIRSDSEGRYVGVLVDGVRQGQGRYTFPEGQFYQGEFDQGNFHGKGRFQYGNGDYYDGEWINNQRQGNGIYHFNSGSEYKGLWKNGQQEGQGVLSEENGNQYQGNWLKGLPHGEGVKRYADGRHYQGQFIQGKFSGSGVFTTPNGRRYNGQWREGKRSGHGEFIFINGDRYQGLWGNNQLNGLGRYEFANGYSYQGKFSQGRIQGTGKFVVPDRFEYVGEIQDSQFQGYGRLIFNDGLTYSGNFIAGKFNGNGIFSFKDGGQYSGEWKNSLPEGYGRYRASNKADFSGRWKNGVLLGGTEIINLTIPGDFRGVANLSSTNLEAWALAATGVGVFVSPQGHVLTTQNVSKGCELITFNKQGAEFVAGVRAEDHNVNLTLLTTVITPETFLTLSHKDIFIMKELWALRAFAKMPRAVKKSLESVLVSAVSGVKNKATELQIEGDFETILAGSPVVDNNGRLTALVEDKRALQMGYDFWRQVPENTQFAIKSKAIERFLNTEGLLYPLEEDQVLSYSGLETLLSKATVHLSCWMSASKVEAFKDTKILFGDVIKPKFSKPLASPF
ncbi:MAG: hypothetical protein QF470_01320 [Methylococcales bacterium]|jgi:hypothetical protein|nr:hypothetical protein [Methylococcales bacterium]